MKCDHVWKPLEGAMGRYLCETCQSVGYRKGREGVVPLKQRGARILDSLRETRRDHWRGAGHFRYQYGIHFKG